MRSAVCRFGAPGAVAHRNSEDALWDESAPCGTHRAREPSGFKGRLLVGLGPLDETDIPQSHPSSRRGALIPTGMAIVGNIDRPLLQEQRVADQPRHRPLRPNNAPKTVTARAGIPGRTLLPCPRRPHKDGLCSPPRRPVVVGGVYHAGAQADRRWPGPSGLCESGTPASGQSTWTLLAMDDVAGLARTTGCNGYGRDFRTVTALIRWPAQRQGWPNGSATLTTRWWVLVIEAEGKRVLIFGP